MLTTTQLAGRERHRETHSEICREACSPETARDSVFSGGVVSGAFKTGRPSPKCALCTPMTDTTNYYQHGKVRPRPSQRHGQCHYQLFMPNTSAPVAHAAYMHCTTRHGLHISTPLQHPFSEPLPAPPQAQDASGFSALNPPGDLHLRADFICAAESASAGPTAPHLAANTPPQTRYAVLASPKGAQAL